MNDRQEGSKTRVIVTGADGFLGSNVVRELLSRGYEVYGFIQNGRDAHTLRDLPVKLFFGDLCNPKDLVPLFRDCEYIIHTAGLTSVWPSRSSASWKVNYSAVKQLYRLSRKYKIRRFIHIGTATSFGYGSLSNPGTEMAPNSSKRFRMDYLDSKYKAQEYLIHKAKTQDFPAIILNPTFMIGPYDTVNGSNKMVYEIYNRNIPGYSKGGKNYVYVKDVAVAAVNSIHMGRIGECYIVGNRNLSYKEAFGMIAGTLKVPQPKIPLPSVLAMAYGAINVAYSSLTGKKPVITLKMARIGATGCYYSPVKAIQELDLPQTPIELAVEDSYNWFREQGLLQ